MKSKVFGKAIAAGKIAFYKIFYCLPYAANIWAVTGEASGEDPNKGCVGDKCASFLLLNAADQQ